MTYSSIFSKVNSTMLFKQQNGGIVDMSLICLPPG